MSTGFNLGDVFERLGGIEPAVGSEFNPLDEAAISAIESAIGATLPPTYRAFLATYGATIFSESVYFRPDTPFPPKYSKSNRGILGALFGQAHPKFPKAKSISVLHMIDVLRESISKDMVPIGDDGGGDVICLRIRQKPLGAVYLWDHENRGRSETDIYPVSASFDEWITHLATE
jgi:hypothetical protein